VGGDLEVAELGDGPFRGVVFGVGDSTVLGLLFWVVVAVSGVGEVL